MRRTIWSSSISELSYLDDSIQSIVDSLQSVTRAVQLQEIIGTSILVDWVGRLRQLRCIALAQLNYPLFYITHYRQTVLKEIVPAPKAMATPT